MRRNRLAFIAAIVCMDQLIKMFIRRQPVGIVIFRFVPFFEITHSTNTGVAFSLLSGKSAFILVLSAILLILCAWLLYRMRLTHCAKWAVACLMGGGMGNLMDRLFFGAVTDYICLLPIHFPVFNLADICITCAIALLMVLIISGRLEERGDYSPMQNVKETKHGTEK